VAAVGVDHRDLGSRLPSILFLEDEPVEPVEEQVVTPMPNESWYRRASAGAITLQVLSS
jgi:hypothetical protein